MSQEPTSLAEWRQNKYKIMKLPSGNVAKLKRAALIDLIAGGGIPDTLSALATELVQKKSLRELSTEEIKAYKAIIDIVTLAVLVVPKVGQEPDEEQLGINEIDFVDKIEIFNWANGASSSLRPFRPTEKIGTLFDS